MRPTGAVRTELRGLLRLAGPLIAGQSGQQLMSFVDTAMVGRLDSAAIGGVGIGSGLFFAMTVIGMGTSALPTPDRHPMGSHRSSLGVQRTSVVARHGHLGRLGSSHHVEHRRPQDHLSQYPRRVRAGETIWVNDRDRIVAKIDAGAK